MTHNSTSATPLPTNSGVKKNTPSKIEPQLILVSSIHYRMMPLQFHIYRMNIALIPANEECAAVPGGELAEAIEVYDFRARSDHIECSNDVILTFKDNYDGNMTRFLNLICKIHRPSTIMYTLYLENDIVFKCKSMTFDEMVAARKFEEKLTNDNTGDAADDHYCWDTDNVYSWYISEMLPSLTFLSITSKHIKKLELIKDKECPVLNEPLKSNCIILKKCMHMISKEAWDKLKGTSDGKLCPLCRNPHHHYEVGDDI